MRKVLIPVDGSERSKIALTLARKIFLPGEVSVKLLIVQDDSACQATLPKVPVDPYTGGTISKMRELATMVLGYNPDVSIVYGQPGDMILEIAKSESIDLIIMTKSTKTGWTQTIGSVTSQVVKHAPCMVLIAPEL